MSDWRTQYEKAADEEAARFARASDRELLEAIRNRTAGQYYTVWHTLAARRATPEVCWLLYDVLTATVPTSIGTICIDEGMARGYTFLKKRLTYGKCQDSYLPTEIPL